MLFFQALLLAGYAYAHCLTRLSSKRAEAVIHTVLLVGRGRHAADRAGRGLEAARAPRSRSPASCCCSARASGCRTSCSRRPARCCRPGSRARGPGENPYRLFAISNLASLLALIGYPFLVEPFLGGVQQVSVWSWLFAAFALALRGDGLADAAAARSRPATRATPRPREERRTCCGSRCRPPARCCCSRSPTTSRRTSPRCRCCGWCRSRSTSLSFIITFEGKGWYRLEWLWAILLALIGAMGWLLVDIGLRLRPGGAARRVPAGPVPRLPVLPRRALPAAARRRAGSPRFYLAVSAGGALGGLLVAVVAPLVFNGYYELGIGAGGARAARRAALRARSTRCARFASLAVLLGIAASAAYDGFRYQRDVRVATRSFYGVLRVKEYGAPGEESHLRRLVHGAIMHGEQYLHDKFRARAHHLLPRGFGHRRRDPLAAGGPAGARRRHRPGHRHHRRLRAQGRRLPLLRHRCARDEHRAAASSPTSATARRRSSSRWATRA